MLGEAMMGEEPMTEAPAPEATDDFTSAIQEAFPDNTWTPERVDAMKTAIKLCLEQDQAGGYDDDADKGGLALILGEPKKKG